MMGQTMGRDYDTASGKKGRKREWDRNFMLYAYAKVVEAEFSLPLTRNDASPAYSACDALAVAFEKVGYTLEVNPIKQRCVSDKFARVREYYNLYVDKLEKPLSSEASSG